MQASGNDDAGIPAHLAAWFAARMPQAEAIEVSGLSKPGAGQSNQTLLFTLSWRERAVRHARDMVIRLQPTAFHVFPEYDLSRQYRIMEALAPTGLPVPTVRGLESDASVLGSPFYLMDKIDGQIPSDIPPYHTFGFFADASPAQRAEMWWSGIELLARLHALDWRQLGVSFLGAPPPGSNSVDQVLAYQERYLEWACGDKAYPIQLATLQWLKENRFVPKRTSLCWGDARLGNAIFRDCRVVGLLDWEMAFIGDPEADLMWWIYVDWMTSEGYGIPRQPGTPSREETIARYEELAGTKVEHPLYWEVLAAFYNTMIFFRLALRMEAMGVPMPAPDFATNNVNSQALARLLNLPPPGAVPQRSMMRLEEVTKRVQFHLTGPGGGDWYLVVDHGTPSRHDGVVDAPDVTVTVTAADWAAMQRGEVNRLQAYMAGKIRTEGDLTLFMQLEDVVAKLSSATPNAVS